MGAVPALCRNASSVLNPTLRMAFWSFFLWVGGSVCVGGSVI